MKNFDRFEGFDCDQRRGTRRKVTVVTNHVRLLYVQKATSVRKLARDLAVYARQVAARAADGDTMPKSMRMRHPIRFSVTAATAM